MKLRRNAKVDLLRGVPLFTGCSQKELGQIAGIADELYLPEGETLIEADWRIAHSFVDLLRNNLGRRIVLCDHSGALRVFEAVIRTLDFADYSTIKEGQDSIIAMAYQPGYNTRYDYLQKKGLPLRQRGSS